MLQEEYTLLTGNQLSGSVSRSTLEKAVFEAHNSKSVRRPCGCCRGRGR
jgi:hypothetical protein